MFEVSEIRPNGEPLPLATDGHLRVVFIGAGGAFAKRLRQSNILVIQGDHHVLVDCGTQGPLALTDLGLDVLKVRCYLPTHSHADHIGGFEEVALVNRYTPGPSKPEMIILRDYQDILWSKSLSGGTEFCEAHQGRPLQLSDFFTILRPQNMEIEGRKFWVYRHGPIEIVLMRTRHFPDTAVSVDESQWCCGVYLNRRVWISGDTMFDWDYVMRFAEPAEVLFHDCQLFTGGVHASYEELMTLPREARKKISLYHYGDNFDRPETWVRETDKFTGHPQEDGFLGWTQQQMAYDFY
ncbi:MAG: MBL fold metallo-hydrolase [Nitrospinaceae bacterium]|nr:MBL fold metallo-hydrolase [Nitrospinaceae bacterium]NIR53893.1 MBL fold metallo-hydrolase [Nitrospinaceae bacterium]NIS84307.1 MBL fold metallo-hydrolase [Nitrospinaceae bacterium]NIT81114.1 MBL fold metallo-hydrolase [Nitrospinaceae bacterium]NIU43396.1 MBL fold metallo-hydrolase [Nitrospinaceae bacterium]